MTQAYEEFIVEVLEDRSATLVGVDTESQIVEVSEGSTFSSLLTQDAVIVEVASYPPQEIFFGPQAYPFFHRGVLPEGPVTSAFRVFFKEDNVFNDVQVSVDTPPVGRAIIVDILRNGVSIFTDPADRPTIASGANVATTGPIPSVTFSAGDNLAVVLVQNGTTVAGANLVVIPTLTKV